MSEAFVGGTSQTCFVTACLVRTLRYARVLRKLLLGRNLAVLDNEPPVRFVMLDSSFDPLSAAKIPPELCAPSVGKCSLFHRLKKNVNKIYVKIFLDRKNYF